MSSDGAIPGTGVPEEQRRNAVLSLQPGTPDLLRTLLGYLGDPSWRVRKAALAVVPRFAADPGLVVALISGLAVADNAGLRNACYEALQNIGEGAVDALTAALRSNNVHQRKFVANILGALESPRARSSLFDALDDPDGNVRASVAEALGAIGGREVIARLEDKLALARGDLQMSVYVLDALGRAHAQLPFELLKPWIGEMVVARLLYPLLGLCADPRAAMPLVEGVVSSSRGARHVAVKALCVLAQRLPVAARDDIARALVERQGAVGRIVEALDATEDDVARAAVVLLGVIGDPAQATSVLRASASRSFVQLGIDVAHGFGAAAAQPLLDSLSGADLETQVVILEVLERLGDASVAPHLFELAQSGEGRVAESAIRAVGKLGDARLVPPLVALGRTTDMELTRHIGLALEVLARRHPEAVGDAVRAAIDADGVRPAWITILGRIARPTDRHVVVAAVHHRDPSVRCAAIEAAQAFEGGLACDTLVFSLADEHPQVRCAAARSLGRQGDGGSVDALLVAMRDPDRWVVAEAARALGKLGDPRAEAALMAAVQGPSSVAIAALQGLFRLNPPGLQAAIERALDHDDPEVVREAITTTMRLPAARAQAILVGCLSHASWDVRNAAAEALAGRSLAVDPQLVRERIEHETEPLVRESLERLLPVEKPA